MLPSRFFVILLLCCALCPRYSWANEPLDYQSALAMAQAYFISHSNELQMQAGDLDDIAVKAAYYNPASDSYRIYLKQRWEAIEVFDGDFTLVLSRDQQVIHTGDRFHRGLAGSINSPSSPSISASDAVRHAAGYLGLGFVSGVVEVDQKNSADQASLLEAAAVSSQPIRGKLVWARDTDDRGLRLAWSLDIDEISADNFWNFRVDSQTGQILSISDYVDHASYQVFPFPVESPAKASPPAPSDGRTTVVDPANSASPFGWHDIDGVAGSELTVTSGNNAFAYEDSDKDNKPPASLVDCGPTLNCSFPLDLTAAPSTYIPASVTNLFYWNNIVHDVMYGYGFDELAGNFQRNNYGNGGAGEDAVLAETQDGSGTCNANFATQEDGIPPRMQMYICGNTSPARDSSFDSLVVVHEYAHGISNRLTGGPGNASCLDNDEQMGEGWSDFYGLLFTLIGSDQAQDARRIMGYAFGSPSRPGPYSTDPAINGSSYDTIRSVSKPHGVGWVWMSMLWEMVWDLIDMHGFNPNIYDAWDTGGNNLAMQLVTDGLAMQSCSPGFVDGRDAILAADQALTGGENACLIWKAFARRGLGYSASQGSPNSIFDGEEAFDLPEFCQTLTVPEEPIVFCGAEPPAIPIVVGNAFTAPVDLSLTAGPAGVQVDFSANPVAGPLPQLLDMTLSGTASLPHGFNQLTITGDDGVLAASADIDLSVFTQAPGKPILTDPLASELQPLRPRFQWVAEQGQTFVVEIDEDPAFSSSLISEELSESFYIPPTSLAPETSYHWRVRAANPCGEGMVSSSGSFTTVSVGKLIASLGDSNDEFGTAVAVRDGFAVIGAPHENNSGAVYLYGRNHGGADAWTLIKRFTYQDSAGGELFGSAVAIDSDTLAIGIPGAMNLSAGKRSGEVQVFERNSGGADNWGRVQVIAAYTPATTELFGAAIALDVNHLVIGAPGDDDGGTDDGSAAIYRKVFQGWSFWGFLKSSGTTGQRHGSAVAISRNWAAVGSPGDDQFGTDSGSVSLYRRNLSGADAWGRHTTMSIQSGTRDHAAFGSALSMDMNTLIVGAPGDQDGRKGSVRIHKRNTGGADNWGELTDLKASDDADWPESSRYGISVALYGNYAVVGRSDPGSGGAAYLIEKKNRITWLEIEAFGTPDGTGGKFGNSVSIDDGDLLVGSPHDDYNGNENAGSAFHFHLRPTGWVESKIVAPANLVNLGVRTDISGDFLITSYNRRIDSGGIAFETETNPTGSVSDPYPRIYRENIRGEWDFVTELTPVFPPDGDSSTCDFGESVAIDDEFAVVGDSCYEVNEFSSGGAVFVFRRNQGGPDNWGQVDILIPWGYKDFRNSNFGWSVDIDNDLIVVGDPELDKSGNDAWGRQGGASVFRRNVKSADDWLQIAQLDSGQNHNHSPEFGETVRISGRRILVGAPEDTVSIDGLLGTPGAGHLYETRPFDVRKIKRIVAPDSFDLRDLGWVADIDGDELFMTPVNGDGFFGDGSYFFQRNLMGGESWDFLSFVDSPSASDIKGASAVDAGLFLASGHGKQVHVFLRNMGGSDRWGEDTSMLISPGDASEGWFGARKANVAFDRGYAVIGEETDDEGAENAGAVYVYKLQGTWNVVPPPELEEIIFSSSFEGKP